MPPHETTETTAARAAVKDAAMRGATETTIAKANSLSSRGDSSQLGDTSHACGSMATGTYTGSQRVDPTADKDRGSIDCRHTGTRVTRMRALRAMSRHERDHVVGGKGRGAPFQEHGPRSTVSRQISCGTRRAEKRRRRSTLAMHLRCISHGAVSCWGGNESGESLPSPACSPR